MSRSILANERPFGFAQPTFCLGLGSGDPNHPSAVTSTSDGRTYTYDANGNMLTGAGRTFTWDADNRVDFLTAQGGMVDMAYDYTGIRIKKNAPGGITYFPFAGYEIDPFGTVTKYIRIGIENIAAKKGGDKLFYHNDHLGGVNVITDIFGAMAQLDEYDPWGKVSRSEGSVDPTKRFTGKELDPESGLYYYGGRYYDPELGRFISPDPFVQSIEDPQNFNHYSYVENNPVNKLDPSGYKGFWKKIGHFFKKAVHHIINTVRVVTAILAYPVAPEYTFLELTSVATSYIKGRTAQMFSMVSGIAAQVTQVGRGVYDHINNPGKLVDVKTGQIVTQEAAEQALQGTKSYGIPGVYQTTIEDAIMFGREAGVELVRWNQSSGPLGDLIKAGLSRAGFESALQGAVEGDLAMGASSLTRIVGHSMGTAIATNALQSQRLAGALTNAKVDLYAPIVSQSSINLAHMVSGATIMPHANALDAVTYLGRTPLVAPIGAVITPLIPFTHPCNVACRAQ